MTELAYRNYLFGKFKISDKFLVIENFKYFTELNNFCTQNDNQLVLINSIKTIESFKSMISENKTSFDELFNEFLTIVLFTSDTFSSLNKMCLKLLQQNYKTDNQNIFDILNTLLNEENEEYFQQNIDNINTVFSGFSVSQEFNFQFVFKYFEKVFKHLKHKFNDKLLEKKSLEMNSNSVNLFCDLYHSCLKSLYILIQKFKTFDKNLTNKLLKSPIFLSLIQSVECQVFELEVIPIGCLITGSLILSLVHYMNDKDFQTFVVYVNEEHRFDDRSRLALISSSIITFPSNHLKDSKLFNDSEVLKSFVKNKNRKESQFLILHSNLFLNWTQVIIKILKNSNVKQKVLKDNNWINTIDLYCNVMIEFVENNFNSSVDQIDRILKNIFLIKQCLLSTQDLRQYFRSVICELDCKSKNPLNKYRFLTQIYQSIGPKDFIEVFGELIKKLFVEIKVLFEEKNDGTNEIFHLISVIISLPDQTIIDQLIGDLCVWIKSEEVCHQLRRTNLLFGIILPKLMKKQPIFVKTVCNKLLEEQNCLNCKQILSVIKVIKAMDENLLDSKQYNQCLNKSLKHFEDDIRLDSLSLIIENRKTTQIFNEIDLQLIRDSIDYNMNCQQSSTRQRFIALIQKLFQRLINSLNFSKTSKAPDYEKLRSEYNYFIENLVIYCLKNLRKTQYFGNTSAKLQILELINSIVFKNKIDFTFHRNIDFNQYFPNLLDIISDSFEENKSLSVKILINYFEEKLLTISAEQINQIKRIATNLSESPTPGQSITGAYIYKLIINIEVSDNKTKNDLIYEIIVKLSEDIDRFLLWAKKDVVISAAKYPLFTKLSSIRWVLNEVDFGSISVENIQLWKQLIVKVIDQCYECSHSVTYIVCNDSPEGHLPMDCHLVTQEFIANLLNLTSEHISNEKVSHITSQMLLLNGWKTIKESAWLLAELCRTANQFNFHSLYDKPIIDCNQTIAIIEFLYSNLLQLKHRGAFEQTASAFTLLIANVWTNKCFCSTKVVQLLHTIIYNLEEENESEVKGCLTRRSAGLPFVIQAVLSGEPTVHSNQYFNQTMTQLLRILSNDCSKDWQIIHCLNIIRALIRDHRMSDKVNPFIEQTVEICFTKFKSNSFSIRNCSAMLCNNLMSKIFGVKRNKEDNSKKNRMSSKLFFTNYPSLYDFLLKEIIICSQFGTLEDNSPTNILHIESLPLYPLLILLSKLMPSISTTTVHNMNEFLPHLKTICLNCRHFKLRVLSAKVLAQLIQESDIEDNLNELCNQLIDSTNVSQNTFHGISLILKHLLVNLKNFKHNIVFNYENSMKYILNQNSRQICDYSLTPFIQIIEILCERQLLTTEQKYRFSEILLTEFEYKRLNSKCDEYMVCLSRSLISCMDSIEMKDKFEFFIKQLFSYRNDNCFEAKLITLKILINSVLIDIKTECSISQYISYESVFPLPSITLPNIKLYLNDQTLINVLLGSPELYDFIEICNTNGFTSDLSAVSNAIISEIFRFIFYISNNFLLDLKSNFKLIYGLDFGDFIFNSLFSESVIDEDIKSCLLLTSSALIEQSSDQQLTSFLVNGFLKKWFQIIVTYSCDQNYIINRKVVTKVLSLSLKKIIGMSDKNICLAVSLWKALINLIEDNEEDIRRKAVEVVIGIEDSEELIASQKALELCVKQFAEFMSIDPISCVYYLIYWMIDSNEEELESDDNEDRLFDKSKLNIFADSLHLSEILLKQLKTTLMSKTFDLNDLRLPMKELMESFGLKQQIVTTNEDSINSLLIRILKDNNSYGLEQRLLESNDNTFKQTICLKLIQTLIETTNNGFNRQLQEFSQLKL